MSKVQNRTGYWYLAVMAVREPMSQQNFTDHVPLDKHNVRTSFINMVAKRKKRLNKHCNHQIINFNSSYWLRVWTSGCYYYNEVKREWMADGLAVRIISL